MNELKNKLQSLSKAISGALLGDSPVNKRTAAAELLGMLNDDNSYYSLFEGLQDTEPEVRKTCLQSIIKHNRPDAVPKMAEYMEDESPDVRIAAAEGLGNLGNASLVPALESYIQRENVFPVREAISKAVDRIKNRLTKEEVQHLMEEKFKLEISRRDTETQALTGKFQNMESLLAETTTRNSTLESEFNVRTVRNRKIITSLLAGIIIFVVAFAAGNFFILRKIIVSRKQAVAEKTAQLSESVSSLKQSLSEKETALAASTEYFEKSEEMFRAMQKSGKSVYGKDPGAELLYEKTLSRFMEASKLPVSYEQKTKVRELCVSIAELIRRKKMDQAIDDFTKLEEQLDTLKTSQ